MNCTAYDPKKIINVVFDIDEVLAITMTESMETVYYLDSVAKVLTPEELEGVPTHYLTPAAKEAIRRCALEPNMRVSIASSGLKQRNDIFAKCLYDLALPEPEYSEIKRNVCILSRTDLSKKDFSKDGREYDNCNVMYGTNAKDLTKVLREGELLENAILIDDDSQYVVAGQVDNCLEVLPYWHSHFTEFPVALDPYLLDYYLKENSKIRFGKKTSLSVYKQENAFILVFLDKESKEIKEQPISEAENQELILGLNEAYEKFLKKKKKDPHYGTFIKIKNKDTRAKLHELAESIGGHTERFFYRANQIYYIIGLLFKVLEKAEQTGRSPSEVLFQKQFKQIERNGRPIYRYKHKELTENDKYYHYGLQKLREVNPDLEFSNPYTYRKYCTPPTDPERQARLKKAQTREINRNIFY